MAAMVAILDNVTPKTDQYVILNPPKLPKPKIKSDKLENAKKSKMATVSARHGGHLGSCDTKNRS